MYILSFDMNATGKETLILTLLLHKIPIYELVVCSRSVGMYAGEQAVFILISRVTFTKGLSGASSVRVKSISQQ